MKTLCSNLPFGIMVLRAAMALLLASTAGLLGQGAEHLHDKLCASDPMCGLSGSVTTTSAAARKWSAEGLLASEWKSPQDRKKLDLSHKFSRHDGKELRLDEFRDPIVVTFVYTRCLNPNKCLAATTRIAELQRRLSEAKLLSRVRLALITYDPRRDTEEVLQKYATANSLSLDDRTFFLRPATEDYQQLFSDLGAAASFYSAQVSMHEIKLLVIDQAGSLARSYKTLIWNNDDVLNDLQRLLNEGPARTSAAVVSAP